MRAIQLKRVQREKRKKRVRHNVFGTTQRPRLSVFRSHKQIYAQVIDDSSGRTICSASSRDKACREQVTSGGNCDGAKAVGRLLAEAAQRAGVRQLVFDRGGYRYHGRVKALADAVRAAGVSV